MNRPWARDHDRNQNILRLVDAMTYARVADTAGVSVGVVAGVVHRHSQRKARLDTRIEHA